MSENQADLCEVAGSIQKHKLQRPSGSVGYDPAVSIGISKARE